VINISYIETKEDYAVINIDSPLHGHFDILIDLEDVDRCKNISWSIQRIRYGKDKEYYMYYATNNKLGMLHRYLVNAPKGVIADHKDGNTYDNRKQNIRICDYTGNNRNAGLHVNNKSGHKGVIWYYYHDVNKWWASICVDRKIKSLGYYDDYEDAVKARESAEKKYYGEYSRDIDYITN
jgi:hypothetical protein